MATIEERFQAAVNVIKGLPKNGPYQPSTAMLLKFYGYFKQATEGPCHTKKPAFWDIVGKAKWEAWMANRHLTKQQAMQKYVDELREIIETMSFTENVQNFVGSISNMKKINLDELDLIAPGVRQLAESHPDSPFNSRIHSPQHFTNGSLQRDHENTEKMVDGANTKNADSPLTNDHIPFSTMPDDCASSAYANSISSRYTVAEHMTNGMTVEQSDEEYDDPVDVQSDFTEAMIHNSELLRQIQLTVLRMNADITNVNQRISLMEKSLMDVRNALQNSKFGHQIARQNYPKWWPFTDISPAWFVLLILCPFLLNRMSRLIATARRK